MQTIKTATTTDYSQVFDAEVEEKQHYFCTYELKVSEPQIGPYVAKHFELISRTPVESSEFDVEDMLPSEAYGISRLKDGTIRYFFVNGIQHFTEAGKQWWTALSIQTQLSLYGKVGYTFEEQAQRAAETQKEIDYRSYDIHAGLDWRDRYNASK